MGHQRESSINRKALSALTEKLGELHPHTKAIMKSVAEMEAYVVASKR